MPASPNLVPLLTLMGLSRAFGRFKLRSLNAGLHGDSLLGFLAICDLVQLGLVFSLGRGYKVKCFYWLAHSAW